MASGASHTTRAIAGAWLDAQRLERLRARPHEDPSRSRLSVAPRSLLAGAIFFSRWLQAPLYLGLIVAQAVYVWRFVVELWHLASHAATISETDIMLSVLGLIDVVMIANLLVMVIIGGYETFVSRLNLQGHPDEPQWLSHVNANVLKVKLATALIGISSIHLLKTFIRAAEMGHPPVDWTGVMWQVIIHTVFLISALALAGIERMTTGNAASHGEGHAEKPAA